MAQSAGTAAPPALEVWLVEDNDLLRDSYASVLDAAPGIRCPHAFETCEEALERLQAGGAPDIVLLDIELPGMDGIEGAARIQALAPNTRIVMLTVHEDRDRVFRALCAGATGYILKVGTADAVVGAVEELRRGGIPMSAQIARRVLEIFHRWSAPAREYGLSDREREVLQFLVDGLGQKEIAARLDLSQHTVNSHIRNIYGKLHVHTRTTAVAKALRERLV
jgi:DNA-binding NarL/FixJ family response regulator